MRDFDEYTNIFFWDFKRMDNANYNFKILNALCHAKKDHHDAALLNKPIILTIMGIVECILIDFIKRINEHRSEKIPNLDEQKIIEIRKKTLKKLKVIVEHAEKHNLFLDNTIYEKLNHLIPLRNRIHIQDEQHLYDKNEYKIWTNANVHKAGEVLEEVCAILCNNYPRPERVLPHMKFFPKPWVSYDTLT